jgi:hypothetical protein
LIIEEYVIEEELKILDKIEDDDEKVYSSNDGVKNVVDR